MGNVPRGEVLSIIASYIANYAWLATGKFHSGALILVLFTVHSQRQLSLTEIPSS